MLRNIGFLCFVTLAYGCSSLSQTSTTTSQVASYSKKPSLSLIPVIDSSANVDLPWDLSEEFTCAISQQLLEKNHVALNSPEKVYQQIKKLTETHHPFHKNTQWMKKIFSDVDFVAFLELIEHTKKSCPEKKVLPFLDNELELDIQMRLRVIDVRGETPRVVLQEILDHSYHLAKEYERVDLYKDDWKTEKFSVTSMGSAHHRLSQEVASRLEDYILLATKKSHASE